MSDHLLWYPIGPIICDGMTIAERIEQRIGDVAFEMLFECECVGEIECDVFD
ncbi:hypothetical protein [Modicisalibacter coralii]|uniref:hypothetical protein n=1 Tax=Modicisalibacter coralii TaxID=2304602 RepID=UPI001396C44E|nr:hypothetical protein [Halomonas coralii]